MYVSFNELEEYRKTNPRTCYFTSMTASCTKKERYAAYKQAIANIISRNPTGVWKWYRPWEVVPHLRNFKAPDGDYGIGIELELGFPSREVASSIARAVQHWKYITLDFEGGNNPIEATFPPVLLSKLNNAQIWRYLMLINSAVVPRDIQNNTYNAGCHINISKGGTIPSRISDRCATMSRCLYKLHTNKYFNRAPYGYLYWHGKFVEMKMFKATTDKKEIKKYINIAVALADLLYSSERITGKSVAAALELGYNKTR